MTYISIWNQYFRNVLEVAWDSNWDIVTQFGTIQIVTQVETQIVTQVQKTRTITIVTLLLNLQKQMGQKVFLQDLNWEDLITQIKSKACIYTRDIHYHYIQFPLSL